MIFHHIGFLVFPRLTLLDLIGPYDALRRVRTMGVDPALRWTFYGTVLDPVDDSGTRVHVDQLLPPPALGGFGVDDLRASGAVRAHLAAWPADRPIASVCSCSRRPWWVVARRRDLG